MGMLFAQPNAKVNRLSLPKLCLFHVLLFTVLKQEMRKEALSESAKNGRQKPVNLHFTRTSILQVCVYFISIQVCILQ